MFWVVFGHVWTCLTLPPAILSASSYSAVRKQGFQDTTSALTKNGSPENVVLDYQMQQYRIFKALSLAYCLLWNKR